jgi:hypothetical protein
MAGLEIEFPSPDIGECEHKEMFVMGFRVDVSEPLFT